MQIQNKHSPRRKREEKDLSSAAGKERTELFHGNALLK
jgi:hypothetical protein